MSVFDFDCNNLDNNAYLNWWFDERATDNQVQIAWDFFNMGKAYYANAITSLTLILDSKNKCSIADKLIFPILFGFWHGTELLLKAGLYLVEKELNTGKPFSKISHDNSQLFNELMSRLKKIGFKESDFKDLKEVLDDFNAKNASPTFMRYTVDDHFNEQFYIDKHTEGINTCINLNNFFENFSNIIETLPLLVEFLGVPYFGDLFSSGELNKANYDRYLAEDKRTNEVFFKNKIELFTENLDLTNTTLEYVFRYLL